MDETSGVALELKTGVPAYQVEDEEARTHLLIHLPIEEQNERQPSYRVHNHLPVWQSPITSFPSLPFA
jgi:hypothetical protein